MHIPGAELSLFCLVSKADDGLKYCRGKRLLCFLMVNEMGLSDLWELSEIPGAQYDITLFYRVGTWGGLFIR